MECAHGRRCLILASISELTSTFGLALCGSPWWRRTRTAPASMSRPPMTSMVWTRVFSASAIFALNGVALKSDSTRTMLARSSANPPRGVARRPQKSHRRYPFELKIKALASAETLVKTSEPRRRHATSGSGGKRLYRAHSIEAHRCIGVPEHADCAEAIG